MNQMVYLDVLFPFAVGRERDNHIFVCWQGVQGSKIGLTYFWITLFRFNQLHAINWVLMLCYEQFENLFLLEKQLANCFEGLYRDFASLLRF